MEQDRLDARTCLDDALQAFRQVGMSACRTHECFGRLSFRCRRFYVVPNLPKAPCPGVNCPDCLSHIVKDLFEVDADLIGT